MEDRRRQLAAAAEDGGNDDDGGGGGPFLAFRGGKVKVTHGPGVTRREAYMAAESPQVANWVRNLEKSAEDGRRIVLHSVEVQGVDLFGARGVGFVKLNGCCSLVEKDGGEEEEEPGPRLPGICFLRGDAVAVFVALYCREDDGEEEGTTNSTAYSIFVDQPRVPIGIASCLELPAGMLDDTSKCLKGVAVQELEEECGILIRNAEDLVNLTELAGFEGGLAPSPGGCDERVKFLYLEKRVTPAQLDEMRGRLHGLREHGELITLRVVPLEDVWKSGDAKAMMYANYMSHNGVVHFVLCSIFPSHPLYYFYAPAPRTERYSFSINCEKRAGCPRPESWRRPS